MIESNVVEITDKIPKDLIFTKGMPKPLEWKELMSKKLKGRKITWAGKVSWTKKQQHKEGTLKIWNRGIKGYKTKLCWNGTRKGKNNINWKGGITKERVKVWRSEEYKAWRKSIFERDNYVCCKCGQVGKNLQAHHLKQFSKFPDDRLNINNGVTLCRACHIKAHKGGN